MAEGNHVILEQTFEVEYIPSVNNYLQPRRGGGMTLKPEVRFFKSEVQAQLDAAKTKFDYSGDKGISAIYTFILKTKFGARDLDNMIKFLQDAIFQNYGINDALVVQINSMKLLVPQSPHEFIKVKLFETTQDFKKFSI